MTVVISMGNTQRAREITVEVDETTAQSVEHVAWDHGVSTEELLRRCCETIAECDEPSAAPGD